MNYKKLLILLLPIIVLSTMGAVNLVTTIQTRIGLSSDTKATSINYGSEFYETDTGITSIYTSSGWVQKYGISNDKATGAVINMDFDRHAGHEGNGFIITVVDTVASGDTLVFCVVVPDTAHLPHFTFTVEGTEQTLIRAFEGASAAANTGAEVTPMNHNRNSATVSVLTVKIDPTITVSEDSLIYEYLFGFADNPQNSGGGLSLQAREFILERDRTYAWLIISKAADNYITGIANWNEHTDRN